MFAIFLSLILEHFVAPKLDLDKLDFAWDCDEYTDEFQSECRGVSSVLRVSAATFTFFFFSMIASAAAPSFNRNYWGLKFGAYLLLVIGTMFMPASTFDERGYLQIARIGSTAFIIIQQIILIDLAYDWNDSWVKNADDAEKEEPESGGFWLKALLAISASIFIASYTILGLLFHFFAGCSTNNWFLSITLIFTLIATALQLTGDEGSILTSAIMTAYAVFLAYSAVSANPNEECNPQLGQNNALATCVGMFFVMASMAWTCFSYTRSSMLGSAEGAGGRGSASNEKPLMNTDEESPKLQNVKGVVTGGGEAKEYGTSTTDTERDVQAKSAEAASAEGEDAGEMEAGEVGQPWKLNLVLILLSCWFAMVLTSWGTVKDNGSAANPSAGETSMWMMMTAQWIALSLYSWTLVAPRLFPDRDFN
jgi:hypothetical protein